MYARKKIGIRLQVILDQTPKRCKLMNVTFQDIPVDYDSFVSLLAWLWEQNRSTCRLHKHLKLQTTLKCLTNSILKLFIYLFIYLFIDRVHPVVQQLFIKVYYRLKHNLLYQYSDTIIISVHDQGYVFRPQVGHHQANTEGITSPIQCASMGSPFVYSKG